MAHRLALGAAGAGDTIEDLIQYSTSGTAVFMQRAATVALEQGEDYVAMQIARARQGRDIAVRNLGATGRVRFADPTGAFYLFFSVDGESDTRKLALRLVDEANVGIAPGFTFGKAGEGFMRLCFARDPAHVETATERLAAWIAKQ
jgi:aspartate/methionine/tyrosine aminotransferase